MTSFTALSFPERRGTRLCFILNKAVEHSFQISVCAEKSTRLLSRLLYSVHSCVTWAFKDIEFSDCSLCCSMMTPHVIAGDFPSASWNGYHMRTPGCGRRQSLPVYCFACSELLTLDWLSWLWKAFVGSKMAEMWDVLKGWDFSENWATWFVFPLWDW